MSYIGTKDYMLEIAKGNIVGTSGVNKFGANNDIIKDTTEDVWDGGGDYQFPTTATITHAHQATDQTALRGGTIEVQGLDSTWDLVVQTVDLNASDTTTLVALTTALIRVFRVKVLEDVVGSSNIILTNSGNTIDYAIITAGNNQTLMSIYTVPNGKTAYMTKYYCTVVDATNKTPTSTRFGLWVADRDNGYEFQLKHAVGIPLAGDMIEHTFEPYMKITQKCDIKITANPIDEDADVASGFDLVLVDI